MNEVQLLEYKLKERYNNKINIVGKNKYNIISGYYHSFPREHYISEVEYEKDKVYFFIMIKSNQVIKAGVINSKYEKSTGHKLAVLSDIYEVLFELYGNPFCFYTLHYDKDGGVYFDWSLNENIKNEEIYNDLEEELDEYRLVTLKNNIFIDYPVKVSNEITKNFKNHFGLPYELIPVVKENIYDYIKYKNMQRINNDEIKLVRKK